MIPAPNPGSEEALKLGCKCPVIDNHYGKGIPKIRGTSLSESSCFWISSDCPLHGSLDIKDVHLTGTVTAPSTAF